MYAARLTCVLALGAMALAAQTIPVDTVRTTAMVGIATGETARLNLLNPAPIATATGTAVACTATVTYFDGSGTPRKTAKVSVAPGTSQFVDLRSDSDLSLAAATRLEIRAAVAIPNIPPPTASTSSTAGTPSTPICTLVSTLEIFDQITLRTQAVVGKEVTVN